MSMSPHEYSAGGVNCPLMPPANRQSCIKVLAANVLGWELWATCTMETDTVELHEGEVLEIPSRGVAFARSGARYAVLAARHTMLEPCGVLALGGTLCTFVFDGELRLPARPCHLLTGPIECLPCVLLESAALNLFYRASDTGAELYLWGPSGWMCPNCDLHFHTVHAYRAHVGAQAHDNIKLNAVLPPAAKERQAPYTTHDHGTVASVHSFNCDLHGRLRLLMMQAARAAPDLA